VTIISSLPGKSVEMKAAFGEKIKSNFLDGREQEVITYPIVI